jgi:hypothetical protein
MLAPNQSYRRMARPIKIIQPLDTPIRPTSPDQRLTSCLPHEENIGAITVAQLLTLMRQLDRICHTVQPTKETLKVAFGHDIRNLFILACTEVESYWRGVLVANSVSKSQLTTRHYVVLKKAMKLGEYEISFPGYPWLQPVKPFANWNSAKPTEGLPWYDAYNAVKHDREGHFERATLEYAFEAVTACVIMAVAQFGIPQIVYSQPEVKAFFNIVEFPRWSEEDFYIRDSILDHALPEGIRRQTAIGTRCLTPRGKCRCDHHAREAAQAALAQLRRRPACRKPKRPRRHRSIYRPLQMTLTDRLSRRSAAARTGC